MADGTTGDIAATKLKSFVERIEKLEALLNKVPN